MTNDERIAALKAAGPEALAGLMRAQMVWARACLAAGLSTSWMPALCVLTRGPDGTDAQSLYVLDMPFNEDHEKRALLLRIGREVYEQKTVPVAAVLTTEAWSAPEGRQGRVEPRHNPARREVVVAFGRSLDGTAHALATLPVERGEGDRIIPGAWGEVQTKGVRCNVLAHLFEGFFQQPRRRMAEEN